MLNEGFKQALNPNTFGVHFATFRTEVDAHNQPPPPLDTQISLKIPG